MILFQGTGTEADSPALEDRYAACGKSNSRHLGHLVGTRISAGHTSNEGGTMQLVYRMLRRVGYPEAGIRWLARRRLLTIAILAALSWALLIGLVWLVWSLITAFAHIYF
jgi:hypothetical protein